MRNTNGLIRLAVVCALVASTVALYIATSAAVSQGALQGASSGALQEDASLAKVVAVIGEVMAVSGGSRVSVTEPQIPFPLKDGDRLETGDDGRASVLFANGTLVRVNSSSVLEVNVPSSSEGGIWARLRILLGEVLIHVLPGDREIQFETPDAIAAVRGTYFGIQVARATDGDSISITTLTTLEGLVAFSAGGTETEVGAGQRCTARGGGAPTRPESVDLAQSLARLDRWVKDLKDKEPAGLRKAGASEDVISQHGKAGLRGSGSHGQGNGAGFDKPENRGATDRTGSGAGPDDPEQETEQQEDWEDKRTAKDAGARSNTDGTGSNTSNGGCEQLPDATEPEEPAQPLALQEYGASDGFNRLGKLTRTGGGDEQGNYDYEDALRGHATSIQHGGKPASWMTYGWLALSLSPAFIDSLSTND